MVSVTFTKAPLFFQNTCVARPVLRLLHKTGLIQYDNDTVLLLSRKKHVLRFYNCQHFAVVSQCLITDKKLSQANPQECLLHLPMHLHLHFSGSTGAFFLFFHQTIKISSATAIPRSANISLVKSIWESIGVI